MNIPITGDFRPLDPALRKRPGTAADRVPTGSVAAAEAGASDRASILSPTSEDIKRYVQVLKNSDPRDLHRIETLRERIRSGSYRADPDEMSGPLAALLEQERPRNPGA